MFCAALHILVYFELAPPLPLSFWLFLRRLAADAGKSADSVNFNLTPPWIIFREISDLSTFSCLIIILFCSFLGGLIEKMQRFDVEKPLKLTKFLVSWVSSEGKFKGPSFYFEPSRSCVQCPWYEVLLSFCCTYFAHHCYSIFVCNIFCLCMFFFPLLILLSAHLPRRIFAHCKDEMDVIIVHCGFRLCTVKLWTVKMFRENSYGKNWITWRACQEVIVHAQVLFRLLSV